MIKLPIMKKIIVYTFLLVFAWTFLQAEDGYRLWLRYDKIENEILRQTYSRQIQYVFLDGSSPILQTAEKELVQGLSGLLGQLIPTASEVQNRPGVMAGIIGQSSYISEQVPPEKVAALKAEGFLIMQNSTKTQLILAAKDDRGLLYGSFYLLRLLQTHQSLDGINVINNPKIQRRVLNHWDNLDRTVERGYAGFSIWNWHELPEFIDQRYIDYARANASIGINGTVVTNVNANSLIFRPDYLQKAAALADVFRPYGIRLYLTARFSSPVELGGLETADPLDPQVQEWWNNKVEEIYQLIPDFGGFLVKANSEGQPGPQQYGRNHADGANMLADALAPHDGIVMWRAFVYSDEEPEDRAKQAYNEFVPLDGQFRDNVIIQVKNGPIDFQPREPIHPLFGAMPKTPLMMEFQITKEYLGQGTHLVGLSTMYEEVLKTDTYAKGKGSLVANVIDGSLDEHQLSGIAGVANIGTARNWTGNLFGQADWYAFGRLAWDPYLDSEVIFREWTRLTFTHDPEALGTIVNMLATSHETCVRYMTPLGLHHIMAAGHHYGPGPWVSEMSRADWTSVYYHRADEEGIGFDRTKTGSDALSQYAPQFQEKYADVDECPLPFLLWFHHVPWDYKLSTGRTLWDELCYTYHQGASEVEQLQENWESLRPYIDEERFRQVAMHLSIQVKEARWWRDACLTYFQTFSQMEIPEDLEQPQHKLQYYKSKFYPYAPGIRPRW
jgi:alpha-glucuronidase